jgi:type IV secretion system coupling TraD/TrwB family protein
MAPAGTQTEGMQNPKDLVTTIGITTGYYRPRPFGIRQPDRLMHVYIIGQTGTGKTTLMHNMMRQDQAADIGFCYIDPHGDLAADMAETMDCLYWNPADPDCPLGYNPLSYVIPEFRPLLASGLIETLKKQWSDAWGARMEHLLRFALLALLERPRSSLDDIVPLFLDKDFRREVLAQVKDQQVLSFWQREYPAMNYKNAADGFAPIVNKIGAFLAHPLVRKTVCEPEMPIKFRSIMDQGQSLVANLAKGRLGADVSNVLGGLIISSIANAAYSRHSLTEAQRRPFFLYVDEFHSFTTGAIADMLAELRKYRLGLVLAGQHTTQTDRDVLDAIIGNVGSIISFRLGSSDAPFFVRHLATPRIETRDLINLPNFEMYVRLMVDGQQTVGFSARALQSAGLSDPSEFLP